MNADIYAKKIWDYMHMNQELTKADCILVLGSNDVMPAHRASDIFMQGYAPVIIFSGNHGERQTLAKSEAEVFADIAYEKGVPKGAVFIENKSTNTGENIIFSKALMEKEHIPHDRIILVQKPYMERRLFATFKKIWPEPEIIVTSPQMLYEEYTTNNPYDEKERILHRMVGDLQRIREYPKRGFQIEQEIPEDVWNAYEELVKMGYTKYLL